MNILQLTNVQQNLCPSKITIHADAVLVSYIDILYFSIRISITLYS